MQKNLASLMEESTNEFELPGFRFHPTEEELLSFYLTNMVLGKKLYLDIIGFLNIYHYNPWDLPGLAKIGEREWFFFVPRDSKHGNGGRPKRTTETGFWKATGSDRKILSLSDPKKIIGLRKTLVFYMGRAPRGSKTDWVMNEYRLPGTFTSQKDVVLCKIYRKATPLKVLEERAAMELEEMKTNNHAPPLASPVDTISFSTEYEEYSVGPLAKRDVASNQEEEEEEEEDQVKVEGNEYEEADESRGTTTSLRLPWQKEKYLPDLQVPRVNTDWTQDSFWTQLRSPWLDDFMTPYANVLNF